MKLGYDIFRKLPDGTPLWVEAVQSLELAKSRIISLAKAFPGDYLVYDLSRNQVVASGTEYL